MIRSALRFVSWSDRKKISAALRPIYHAENEQAAELALSEAAKELDGKYPSVTRTFRNRWAEFVPFLSYPAELRRMLYTTNAVESLNSQLRKTLRQRGPFPNDEAVFKLLFLVIQNAKSALASSHRLDAHAGSTRHFLRRTSARLTSTYTEILTLPHPVSRVAFTSLQSKHRNTQMIQASAMQNSSFTESS